MTIIRQMPRGSTDELDNLILPVGHARMDVTRGEMRLGDGITPGGYRIPSMGQLESLFLRKDEGLGEEVGFPATGSGVLVRLADNTFTLRTFAAGDGITISNPLGAAGNPTYAVDSVWLNAWYTDKVASASEIRSNTPGLAITTSEMFLANGYAVLSDAAQIGVNFQFGWNFYVEIQGDRLMTFPLNLRSQSGIIAVKAIGGTRTFSLTAAWKDPQGLLPVQLLTDQRAYISYFVTETSDVVIAGMTVI